MLLMSLKEMVSLVKCICSQNSSTFHCIGRYKMYTPYITIKLGLGYEYTVRIIAPFHLFRCYVIVPVLKAIKYESTSLNRIVADKSVSGQNPPKKFEPNRI